jgi:hypothetical protein
VKLISDERRRKAKPPAQCSDVYPVGAGQYHSERPHSREHFGFSFAEGHLLVPIRSIVRLHKGMGRAAEDAATLAFREKSVPRWPVVLTRVGDKSMAIDSGGLLLAGKHRKQNWATVGRESAGRRPLVG